MSETPFPDVHEKWFNCNGRQLKKLAHAGLVWLEHNHQIVNALNVFPVPDGDTGTNMLLTMRSAYKRIQDSQEMHAGKLARQFSQGALMGARGNSGVILSQIWRGLARSLENKETFDAPALAEAFQEAAHTAYNGVMKPVEGTILTVIREAAEEARDAARKSRDLRFVLDRILERSNQALERTPALLPILRQAGVVDSGGQGLVFIFEGMMRYLRGEFTEAMFVGMEASAPITTQQPLPAQAHAVPEGGSLEFPYDVQFILMGENLNVEEVRGRIDSMGDSTVVVGDSNTIKVHIHVKDPGVPLSYGVSLGQITDVVVENMQEQMETIVHASGNGLMAQAQIEEILAIQPGQVAVVAVAPGKGLADVFHSLGVAYVVDGGQTNNPSTEEIFQALQDVPTDKIIILPNNKNIILAAEAARDLSPKNVIVVPTRTIPQGVAAMLAWNANGNLEDLSEAMRDASRTVATGQITIATRTVTLDGVDVAEGHIIGMAESQLCASGPDITDVLYPTLEKMNLDAREILTVYYGQDVTPTQADHLAEQIREQYPEIDVELVYGGQPHYYYILGAE